MVDKSITLQHQIKQSAESIRDYSDDLGRWEEEMNAKDHAATQRPATTLPPVRGRADTTQTLTTGPKPPLKRDGTNMQTYYKAWDSFDPDKYLEEIEKPGEPKGGKAANPTFKAPTTAAPAKTKVVVKGGRSNSSELDRLKDQGALHFTGHNYAKALECYQQCLGMNPENAVKVVLNSNSAQCLIFLREFQRAEQEASRALETDPKHVKSLVRRAVASRSLARYQQALADLRTAAALESSNPQIAQETLKTTKTRQKHIQDIKDSMMSAKVSTAPTVRVPVTNIDCAESPVKPAANASKAKEIALEELDASTLKSPTSLTELEKNCRMLAASPAKLRAYLGQVDTDAFAEVCGKSSIESDFLMFCVRKIMETISDQPTHCLELFSCLARIPRLALVTKFLTRREKAGKTYAELKEALDKLQCSPELRSQLLGA